MFSQARSIILFFALALMLPRPASANDFAAANWTLPTPDGEQITLYDALAEGPVVMSFWATWCIPCLKEMPKLNEMAAEFEGQVSFIAVSVDNSKSMAKVGPLVRSRGWTNLTIALDAAGAVQQALQVLSPPYVVVLDGAGREVYRHEGYKMGDELELREVLRQLVTEPAADTTTARAPSATSMAETVTATNQFEYSYDLDTDKEIVENWLDVAYHFDGFRTGLMINHQAPGDDRSDSAKKGTRRAEIMHRYFEFTRGNVNVRVGHFYGLFGRGLVWNSYEDRFIRINTALDGVYTRSNFGVMEMQAFSGVSGTTPTDANTNPVRVDVRGLDLTSRPIQGLELGASALTYLPEFADLGDQGAKTHREWVGAARAGFTQQYASMYLEYGEKTGYDVNLNNLDKDQGMAFYGNLGVYLGPLSLSLERSDYENFKVLDRADGKQPLNRPPALVREHIYTLLGRKPHAMDQSDEKGWQLEANLDLGDDRTALVNASRIEDHAGRILFEEFYTHIEQEHIGNFSARAGFGYQDGEEIMRQTVVGDVTYYMGDAMTWSFQAEHQHVRQGFLGEYDQQWFKLELVLPPRWTFDAFAETNNKYDAQFSDDEIRGDFFPAGQISYTLQGGGNLNLWFGKRQAGQLCAGGTCKFEPAFEGVELYGIFRY